MNYTEYAVSQILALCKTPSPTGFTKLAAEYLIQELTSLASTQHFPQRLRPCHPRW
jgi:putative aminopeptidase FrvX